MDECNKTLFSKGGKGGEILLMEDNLDHSSNLQLCQVENHYRLWLSFDGS